MPGGNRARERYPVAHQTDGVCRFRGYDPAHAQMCEPDLRRGRSAGGQHRQLPHRVCQRRPREYQFSDSCRFAGKTGGTGGQPREIAGRHNGKTYRIYERELFVCRPRHGWAISCCIAGAVQSEAAVYCPDRQRSAPRCYFADPECHRHAEPFFPVLCRKPADCAL